MTFSIGLRTIDRPAGYCHQTVLRLAESRTLEHPSLIGFHVAHGESITPNQNGARALHLASYDCADWVIFLEDDIDIIDDFIGSVDRWLRRFAIPDVLVYPLGCAYPGQIEIARSQGVWRYPIEDTFYGSQGLVFRTEDAKAYADFLNSLTPNDNRYDICFDLWLARWHRDRKPEQRYLLTPAPCFIDHTGEFSSLGDVKKSWERCARFQQFAGRDWSYVG